MPTGLVPADDLPTATQTAVPTGIVPSDDLPTAKATAHPLGLVPADDLPVKPAPGHFDIPALEKLVEQNGGTPKEAIYLAQIAMAESSGNPQAHNSYVENGKTHFVNGLWQISDLHGNADFTDPSTAAKQALMLYRKNGFADWEASRNEGNGGGWGPAIAKLMDTGTKTADFENVDFGAKKPPFYDRAMSTLAKLKKADLQANQAAMRRLQAPGPMIPPAGAATLNAAPTPQPGAAPEKNPYAITNVNNAVKNALIGDPAKNPLNLDPATSPATAAIESRAARPITLAGEAFDAPTFAAANAVARDLAGDHEQGIANYLKIMFDPKADLGSMLDAIGNEYGVNSPGEINYWISRPGIRARIESAHPNSAAGMVLQMALGMKADIARLKPKHVYMTGAETLGLELLNPSNWLVSKGAGAVVDATKATATAARAGNFGSDMARAQAGAYGPHVTRLANLAAKSMQSWATHLARETPIAGNRFTSMGDAFPDGGKGEAWHALAAQHIYNAPFEANDIATSDDTFRGLTREEQIDVVHLIEGKKPGIDGKRVVNGISLEDRANNIRAVMRSAESKLHEVDPVAAEHLFAHDVDFPHGDAYVLPDSQIDPDPRWGYYSTHRANNAKRAEAGVVPKGRVYDTLYDAEQAGLTLNPKWIPSGALALQQAKLRRYIELAESAQSLDLLHDAAGKPAKFNIQYFSPADWGDIPLRPGSKPHLKFHGEGAVGFDALQKTADQYAKQIADLEASQHGAMHGWTPEQAKAWATDPKNGRNVDFHKRMFIDESRKIFRSQHPGYNFDASDDLGMSLLKGQAMHYAASDALIDSHPQLFKLAHGTDPSGERFSIHTRDEPPGRSGLAWLESINSAVRAGILANFTYHPFVNLIPKILQRGVNPLTIAAALGVHPGRLSGKQWLDPKLMEEAERMGASGSGGGTPLSIDPHVRAKLITVPYGDFLQRGDISGMALKAFLQAGDWNQNVTFGFFEDRLAAITYKHFKDRGMTPEQAARETRKSLGDYQNLTPAERVAGLREWFYFYTWLRSELRFQANQLVRNPRSVIGPQRGVQTANQLQGDQGSTMGAALSLRDLWGTDANGNPIYASLPFPMLRYGGALERFGSLASGNPNDAASTAVNMAESHLTPFASLAVSMGLTPLLPAAEPEIYNNVLWNKDAPTPAAMWTGAANKMVNRFMPPVIGSMEQAAQNKDPRYLAGIIGPTLYSAPNNSKKMAATYAVTRDLQSAMVRAEQTNPDLADRMYEIYKRLASDDPTAVAEARRLMKEENRLRNRTRHPRP